MKLSHRGKLHASPAPNPPTRPPLIELHNVSLIHDHTPLITHLDLTIHPGEHVALIGLSPTATTALTHLLTGHTTPTHGHITTHTTAHLTTEPHPTHAPLLIHTGPTPLTPPPTTALIHITTHPAHTADRVLLLHHGRVTETGTHRQLLARGGAYARLYALHGPHRTPPR